MNLIEKIKYAYTKGETMPLKGHVRFVLEDVRDGSQIVEEGDNFITNAVASVIANNYCGLANFAELFPLKSLYGGCLLFQNQMDSATANDFNPPSEIVNPLIAHAGDEPPAIGWTGSKRGTPVSSEYEETDTSIKQVWLWDNTQGIGTIRTVCLCPSVLGNMGLTPSEDVYTPVSLFGRGLVEQGNTWNLEMSKKRPYSISADGKTMKSIYIDGSTFTEYTTRHDILAHGIMRTPTTWQDVDDRSASIRAKTNSTFTFEDDNYYYVATATSATSLRIDKVSKANFTVSQSDMTFSNVSLYTGAMSFANDGVRCGNLKPFAFDGKYLYYPNSAKTHFYRIDITLQDDPVIVELDGTITIGVGENIENAMEFREPIVLSQGLALGSNYIINGNSVYPVKESNIGLAAGGNQNQVWLKRKGASVYGVGKQFWSTSSSSYQGNVLVSTFLSTIYNLEAEKAKGATQTMRLEYTISEQT